MKNRSQFGGESIQEILSDCPRFNNGEVQVETFLNNLTPEDYIIVGGGPVGLQTVVQMSEILKKNEENKPVSDRKKKMSSQLQPKICIIEKRDSNERRQILFIEPMFWNEIHPEIKAYINNNGGLCLVKDKTRMLHCLNNNITDFSDKRLDRYLGYVRIDILQDAYYNYIKQLDNVYICLYDVAVDILLKKIKESKVKNIILSDGGGGGPKPSLSYRLFEGSNYIRARVSNAVVLGFDCDINQHKINHYGELLQRRAGEDNILLNQRQLLTFVTKNVNEKNKFSGYIGLQICDKSYDAIRTINSINKNAYPDCKNIEEAKFNRMKDIYLQRDPQGDCYKHSQNHADPKSQNFPEFVLIQHALNLFTNYKITSVSVFDLTLSSATQFYKRINDQYYFLIGDAAYKTHFFTGTGLNRGFASSSILLQLLLKPDFNRELLATSFNLAQIHMRNKLWKEQIPKFMFDLCNLHKTCNGIDPIDLNNEDLINEKAQCFFENSKKLFSQPAERKVNEIILWKGDINVTKYNEFINELTEKTTYYEKLLSLLLSDKIIDKCVTKSDKCPVNPEEKISELRTILNGLELDLKVKDKDTNFTISLDGGKRKNSSRISKVKRHHSIRRNYKQ